MSESGRGTGFLNEQTEIMGHLPWKLGNTTLHFKGYLVQEKCDTWVIHVICFTHHRFYRHIVFIVYVNSENLGDTQFWQAIEKDSK